MRVIQKTSRFIVNLIVENVSSGCTHRWWLFRQTRSDSINHHQINTQITPIKHQNPFLIIFGQKIPWLSSNLLYTLCPLKKELDKIQFYKKIWPLWSIKWLYYWAELSLSDIEEHECITNKRIKCLIGSVSGNSSERKDVTTFVLTLTSRWKCCRSNFRCCQFCMSHYWYAVIHTSEILSVNNLIPA